MRTTIRAPARPWAPRVGFFPGLAHVRQSPRLAWPGTIGHHRGPVRRFRPVLPGQHGGEQSGQSGGSVGRPGTPGPIDAAGHIVAITPKSGDLADYTITNERRCPTESGPGGGP